jgi:hypothetical protein
MATSIAIEEESGTGSGRNLDHNGYYAGDFWAEPAPAPARRAWPTATRIGSSPLPAGTLKDAV